MVSGAYHFQICYLKLSSPPFSLPRRPPPPCTTINCRVHWEMKRCIILKLNTSRVTRKLAEVSLLDAGWVKPCVILKQQLLMTTTAKRYHVPKLLKKWRNSNIIASCRLGAKGFGPTVQFVTIRSVPSTVRSRKI